MRDLIQILIELSKKNGIADSNGYMGLFFLDDGLMSNIIQDIKKSDYNYTIYSYATNDELVLVIFNELKFENYITYEQLFKDYNITESEVLQFILEHI